MRLPPKAAVFAVIVSVGLLLAGAPAAQADHGISTTGSVNIRTGPGTDYPVVGVVPSGVSPTYRCYTIGEYVNGVRVWFEVTFENQTGFITSYYDDSSYDSPEAIPDSYGIESCDTVSDSDSTSEGGIDPATSETDCSGNEYVSEVLVQDYTEGQFDILVYPTSNTRYAKASGYGQEATWALWHAVQACVPDLYGELADGIYQQIECHILGGLSGPFNAGGAEYGLESWRRPTTTQEMLTSRCNWGGFPYDRVGEPYRTDRLANTPSF